MRYCPCGNPRDTRGERLCRTCRRKKNKIDFIKTTSLKKHRFNMESKGTGAEDFDNRTRYT